MDAGKLDRRVELQTRSESDDGFSTTTGSWTELATVWAQFIPLSASERAQAGETASFQKARYRFRKDSAWSDLNALNGIVDNHSGQSFNILGVTEPNRGWFVAECVGRGDS